VLYGNPEYSVSTDPSRGTASAWQQTAVSAFLKKGTVRQFNASLCRRGNFQCHKSLQGNLPFLNTFFYAQFFFRLLSVPEFNSVLCLVINTTTTTIIIIGKTSLFEP
jgi:hypothetical protein